MILGIDSSAEPAGVALIEEDTVLSEMSWAGQRVYPRRLDGVVRQVLGHPDLSGRGPRGIAVAAGPGSFNGLRVGVSFAKGLAMGFDVPIVGISSLDAIGLQASWWDGPVWALIPAGRGEVYTASYRGSEGAWQRTSLPSRSSLDDIADAYDPGVLLAGPCAPAVSGILRERGVEPRQEAGLRSVGRSAFLAELGRRYFDAGGTDQLDTLELLYLRRSSAEERREASRE